MEIFTIENVKASDVLENYSYYQDLLIEHKVLGFRNLAPSNKEHEEILKKFYKDDQKFILSNWHVDFLPESFEGLSYGYISMHMCVFNCAPDAGKTLFINLIDLYQRCPDEYKKNINQKNLELVNLRGIMPEESLKSRTHRAVGIHPITGESILFWTGGFGGLNKEDSYILSSNNEINNEIWFNNFCDWILSELQNKNNWGVWNWNKDDFIIWDNRALIHSFTAGWNKEDRIFNRSNIGLEKIL